ncbi:MAG: hypothetical protein E7K04_03025 [Helicobacter sp.]|nr:hypothetical protein [Helicobacter sp.]
MASGNCDNIPTYEKPLDDGEKFLYKSFFPKLDVDTARETSISTECYNCLAWTLGITNKWLWPIYHAYLDPTQTTQDDFNRFYHDAGFELTNRSNAEIAAFGALTKQGKLYMTHGAKIYSKQKDLTDKWESKLGAYIRLEHELEGLDGDSYGKPVAFYKKAAHFENVQREAQKRRSNIKKPEFMDIQKLRHKIDGIEPAIVQEFDANFLNWTENWQDSANENRLFSSNPASRAFGDYFLELIGLGAQADLLPLVVLRLYTGDFWANLLYDALQKDESLRVFYGEDCHIFEGEIGRSYKIVERYIKAL